MVVVGVKSERVEARRARARSHLFTDYHHHLLCHRMSSLFRTASSSTVKKDVEVANLPEDSISSLSFSPVADFLAVGSWDNNVRDLLILSILWPERAL